MKKIKVLYISTSHFLDADLMLLQHIQRYVDVYFLLDIANYSRQSNLLSIKELIRKTGWFTFRDKEEILPHFFKQYIDYDKSFIILRSSKKGYTFSNISLQLIITKFIKNLNPEIIHFNNFIGVNYILPYMYTMKYKTILTIHDPIAHTGEFNRKTDLIKKIMIKYCDKLILLNNHINSVFIDKYKINKEKISFTGLGPYWIYKNLLDNNQIKIKNSVLFFGRISPYKGVEYLVEAAKIINNKVQDLKVTIAGNGKFNFDISRLYRDDTFQIINRYINNKELVELIESHSIIVCPYTDATQSGVLMTAIAFNKPIIATSVGNFKDIITRNITSLIVPPKDSLALADAIKKLLLEGDKIERISNNIKNDKKLGLSAWTDIADNTYSVYSTVLKS